MGVFVFARGWQFGFAVGVFARWVAGLGVFAGVFAFLGVGVVSCVRCLPVWGWWDKKLFAAPLAPACLFVCSRSGVGVVGVCGVVCLPSCVRG